MLTRSEWTTVQAVCPSLMEAVHHRPDMKRKLQKLARQLLAGCQLHCTVLSQIDDARLDLQYTCFEACILGNQLRALGDIRRTKVAAERAFTFKSDPPFLPRYVAKIIDNPKLRAQLATEAASISTAIRVADTRLAMIQHATEQLQAEIRFLCNENKIEPPRFERLPLDAHSPKRTPRRL